MSPDRQLNPEQKEALAGEEIKKIWGINPMQK